MACQNGHKEIVEKLLNHEADVDIHLEVRVLGVMNFYCENSTTITLHFVKH